MNTTSEKLNNVELLDALMHKLKGKSVYDTLMKLHRGKLTNRYSQLKGLFSLGTHTAIECEKGNVEYKSLLHDIYYKIGVLLQEDN